MIRFLEDDKPYVIGIDLHGTLLNENWEIEKPRQIDLISSFKYLKHQAYILIITGNDLSFVKEHVPEPVISQIDGFILENGAVFSDGTLEHTLAESSKITSIKSLEKELKTLQIPEVLFFARRLSSISMFTRNQGIGVPPTALFSHINSLLKSHLHNNDFYITHSDVAVDIVPQGHTKWTAINHLFPNKKLIAIADSYNDREFLCKANIPFIPANASPKIKTELLDSGFDILPLAKFKWPTIQKNAYKSPSNYTLGVIEALQAIEGNLK
jgi:hydroxymethylpyrimidine pyrophosphatase-like HAD family hydrolase